MIKKCAFLLVGAMLFSTVNAQTQPNKVQYDFMWINGGLGAGGVVSTNIINSGALLPFYAEFCLQKGRTRLGFGICEEIYLTPENLGKLLFGNSSNVEKYYLTWEWMLIPNFPINIGPCAQIGGFLVGNEVKEKNAMKSSNNFFANAGLNAEVGIRPVFLFVKPWFEFKSYGSFHKELIAAVTLGVKFKLLTKEEKARRAAAKAARKKK